MTAEAFPSGEDHAKRWTIGVVRWNHEGLGALLEEYEKYRSRVIELEERDAENQKRLSEMWKEREALNKICGEKALRVMWLERENALIKQRAAYYVETLRKVERGLSEIGVHVAAATERVEHHRKPA